MKKLLLILTMCIATSAFAQNNFPTSNAIWNESVEYRNYCYGLLGDTIINEVFYSKLYEFSDTILSVEKIHTKNYPNGYVGALRSEEQKVFFKPTGNWTEPDILLYDFGAEVGDTVWHRARITNSLYFYNFSYSEDAFSIINAVHIEDGRKIFIAWTQVNAYYQYYWDNLWIEGVGSNRGILRSLGVMVVIPHYEIDPSNYVLHCFKHNDTVEYLDNPKCNQCFCSGQIGISNNKLEFNHINIYPNPTKDLLNIEIQENVQIKSISIFSIDGKLIDNNNYFFDSKQLNIKRLQHGNYILRIETDIFEYKQLITKY